MIPVNYVLESNYSFDVFIVLRFCPPIFKLYLEINEINFLSYDVKDTINRNVRKSQTNNLIFSFFL